MEQSIARDVKDIEFENKRIESSQGQLEAQIRVAKIRMIEDRIRSKQEKLDELLKTRVKLEKITDKIKKREEKQVERAKDITRLKEEEEKIKAKIADEIHTAQDSISSEEAEKLLKAAEGIKASKAKKAETIVDEVQVTETEQQPTEVVAAAEETVPMKEKLVTEIIPASEFPTSVELSETISENLPDSIDTDVVANQESDNSNK